MADENIVNGKKYKVLQNGIWNILSFFTKASDVEFDDGMNAEEKIKDIEKNGFGIEITQAEYDALSEEEKNNGTYWITDGSGGGGDSSDCLTSADIVDNLESTATNLPLSANMGRELKEQIGKGEIGTLEFVTITTVANTYAELNTTGSLCYIKNGVCYLTVMANGKGTYAGWANIGTIPVSPASSYNEFAPCVDVSNNYNTNLRVATDGKIYITPRGNATSQYWGRISFPHKRAE